MIRTMSSTVASGLACNSSKLAAIDGITGRWSIFFNCSSKLLFIFFSNECLLLFS